MEDEQCKVVCRKPLDKEDIERLVLMIGEEYHVNLDLDNLPVAMKNFRMSDDGSDPTKTYEIGYPVGYVLLDEKSEDEENDDDEESGRVFVNNHLRFTVLYHSEGVEEGEEEPLARIVGFDSFVFSYVLVRSTGAIQGSWWTYIPPMSSSARWLMLPKVRSAWIPRLAALGGFCASGGFQDLRPLCAALMPPT